MVLLIDQTELKISIKRLLFRVVGVTTGNDKIAFISYTQCIRNCVKPNSVHVTYYPPIVKLEIRVALINKKLSVLSYICVLYCVH